MEIRAAKLSDLDDLIEIDGTIDSADYIHVERAGEDFSITWRLEERPLREKRTTPNPPGDDLKFILKQLLSGADEGTVLVAEHEGLPRALLVAQADPVLGTMRLIDLRVDFESRREGLATVMLYQIINEARNRELRAVSAHTRTDNVPAARLLGKCGFELTGLDTHHHSNHDLVKESATLFWYAALG